MADSEYPHPYTLPENRLVQRLFGRMLLIDHHDVDVDVSGLMDDGAANPWHIGVLRKVEAKALQVNRV